jgi:hypothetical protein
MNATSLDKKEQIQEILNKIEERTLILKKTLEEISMPPTIEQEKEFVNSCNFLQMQAKQALKVTGYYKGLCGVPRATYAPEELEGDITPLSELVDVELTRIEEEVKDGNTARPIDVPDITKEQWLEAQKDHQERYDKTHEEWLKYNKERNENGHRKSFYIESSKVTVIQDEEIIAAAKGFMTGPVGLFRNKCVEAETQKFPNIHEMRIFLINVQSKTKDMVLYMTYEQNGTYYWRGTFVNKV